MLTLRRLAELAMMVLVAVPLFGCGNAGNGAAAAGNVTNTNGEAPDIAPADAVAMDRISRIEGRHFDLYRDFRVHAAPQVRSAADGFDDEADSGDDDRPDGALRHAVISFSASSLNQALRGCSMRALMALD